MLRTILLPLAGLTLSASLTAQTTHTVTLFSLSFDPADVTIQVGDTVEWVWSTGFHNVESGVNGVPDGIFSSGVPVGPPQTFSVTFDQAFLDANPVPGKVYDYYCILHIGIGMVGTVTVEVPSSVVARNGGTNPASLNTIGTATIGTTLTVEVDTTTTGHDSALLFGVDTPISVTIGGGQTVLCLDTGGGEFLGQTFLPGPTATFNIEIPNDPALCGFSFCMQAVQFGGVVPFALSDARDVVIGNV